jgi:ADP-ribose pyrophosphatase YjhB (NUDIX family)
MSEDEINEEQVQEETSSSSSSSIPHHHRIWESGGPSQIWTERFIDREDEEDILQHIEEQEFQGARMKAQQLGVLSDDPATDMELLTQNYSARSLASALRDREEALQTASVLAANGQIKELQKFLEIFHPQHVLDRRIRRRPLELLERLDDHALEWIRKHLMRLPRSVVTSHAKRAGVVLALCTVHGVPCVMLEKRAAHLRAHPDEVCLPGGMVCEIADDTIVATCLREMREEIDGLPETVNVLGVYRMNWGDLHHLVGIAVTPVVCYLGELPVNLYPNPDEVSQVFTVSLRSLAEPSNWLHKEHLAPIFLGGPHAIWGLTGYILDGFRKDILRHNRKGAAGVAATGGGGSFSNETPSSTPWSPHS